jgi:excinuclease ABC subunit C
VPGRSEPVEIPRGSEALFMLQRIRDEAHRFANTYHRELRSQAHDRRARSTASPGSARPARRSWSRRLGGVNAVKKASLEELQALSFLPDAVAEAIHAKFHPGT